MEKRTFDAFFKLYSQNVDDVDTNSAFWKLSDKIILEILKKEILSQIGEKSVLMDAGGGTGRWVVKMSLESQATFILFDRSEDMLKRAKENIATAGLGDRVRIVCGDLTEMTDIPDNSVDVITSIYSPISFIYDSHRAFKELNRVLKKGGKIIIMAHGFYNALYSKLNNYSTSAIEIDSLFKKHTVKWASHVPELITYSKETLEQALQDAGFQVEKTFGIPVVIQPGPEDFNPENTTVSKISKYLENENNFKKILEIEMSINFLQTVANRGMNIFTLASKT